MDEMSVTLRTWSGMPWHISRDQMRVARCASVLVHTIFAAGWHTLPFDDSSSPPTLAKVLRELLPMGPVTLVPFHGSADSAGPLPPPAASGSGQLAHSDTTVRPPRMMHDVTSRPAPPP